MSVSTAAHVYLINETFRSISERSEYDEFMRITKKIEGIVHEYKYSKNIIVECAKDFLEYTLKQGELSLEDKLLEMANNDWSIFQYYCDVLEKTISHIKTDKYSNAYESLLLTPTNDDDNVLPRHYVLTVDEKNENMSSFYTSGWTNTLKKNAYFVASKNKDKDEFVSWTKIIHDNLEFHDDIGKTLDTIVQGNYSNYRHIISEALDALNQCVHFISVDPKNNQEDLNTISEYTSKTGRKLSCTRQGKNKPFFDFPANNNSDGDKENINCEYHLKINWDDSGSKLMHQNNVRIYFAIKYDDVICKKQIKVAHIGKHL